MSSAFYEDPYHPALVAEQDDAMELFAAASRRPVLIDEPFILEEQLWKLGGISQRAIEGFGRLRPDLTYFRGTARNSGGNIDYYSEDGVVAYESWIRYDNDFRAPDGIIGLGCTFGLEPQQESSAQTTISIDNYSGSQISITEWKLGADNYQQNGVVALYNCLHAEQGEMTDILIPDAARQAALHGQHVYHPLQEEPGDCPELVAVSMDDGAPEVYRQFGKVGLFQYALHQKAVTIIGSL